MRELQERRALSEVTERSTIRRPLALIGAVAVAVVVADQLTKWWALRALADGPIDLGPVRLAVTRNRGAAFGLGAGFFPLIVAGAVVAVVLLAGSGRVVRRPVVAVAVGLVLGGAVGNLIDRLVRSPGWLRGSVVDFVDLRWWPVFNLADSAITVGCLVLLLASWRPDPKE